MKLLVIECGGKLRSRGSGRTEEVKMKQRYGWKPCFGAGRVTTMSCTGWPPNYTTISSFCVTVRIYFGRSGVASNPPRIPPMIGPTTGIHE
jgi:hypothetical protein